MELDKLCLELRYFRIYKTRGIEQRTISDKSVGTIIVLEKKKRIVRKHKI